MYSKEYLKLAALSKDFKDSDIFKMFFDTWIEKESDINDIIILLKHNRPLVWKRIEKQLIKKNN